MKTHEIQHTLGYRPVFEPYDDVEIVDAYTSDLLSDVMAHAADGGVLITIQAHKNTIAVAELTGQKAIILCNSREAPADMIEAARQENIALFQTQHDQYTASWKIHSLLTQG
ncbi:MAG: iron-sulfur binding hydrogenase [Chitinispirillaceae bacterium]